MTNDLYRHFDEDGVLLYIGISLSSMHRLSQHQNASAWYGDIANMTIEKFDSREEVLIAEKNAIIEEKPKHNIKHNMQKPISKNDIERELRYENSRIELLQNIVTFNISYTLQEVSHVLKIGLPKIKHFTNIGILGSIIIGETYNEKFKKTYMRRIVTGWQLIDFIEHLEAGGEDDNILTIQP